MVAVAIGSRSVGGVDERRRWRQRRGVESEGLFESLVLRVIDLSLVVRVSNRFFNLGFFLLLTSFDLLRFIYLFIIFLFIPNPELRFIKRSFV